MIRYLVNGNAVAIANNISLQLIRENSFFTKVGDYTYDIDIDLHDKNNARLYAGMKRVNGRYEQPKRTVELWDGPRLLCKGVEVILSIVNFVAKVQVVSNNSEMNYMFNDQQKIRKLDLGLVATNNPDDAARVTKSFYSDGVNEAYPVVLKGDFGAERTHWDEFKAYNQSTSNVSVTFDDDTELVPQPYLLAIIKKVITAIGYKVGEFNIDETKYRHLIIVQNYHQTEYAKMLPDWTVEEFIDEVEKFFNVVFVFNSVTRVVDIISVKDYYSSSASLIKIDDADVSDNFTVELTEDLSAFQTSYDHVGYRLDGSEYMKLQRISDETMLDAKHVDRPISIIGTGDVWKFYRTIFYDVQHETYYIGKQTEHDVSVNPIVVNDFADVKNDGASSKNELRIRPAQIYYQYGIDDSGVFFFAAPALPERELSDVPFFDEILKGKGENMSESLDVAFYLGDIHRRTSSGDREVFNNKITQCITTYWNKFVLYLNNFDQVDVPDINETFTLRLEGKHGRVATDFDNKVFVDTSRVFNFTFYSPVLHDPRAVFEIKGRKFFCKQLKYSTVNGSLSKRVEGEFYPAK